MAHFSRCPLCNEPVSVPDDLAEQAQVRCPLCEEQFPLSVVKEQGAGSGVLDAGSNAGNMGATAPALVPVTDVESEGPILDIWKNQQPLVDEVPEIQLGSVLRKPDAKKSAPKKVDLQGTYDLPKIDLANSESPAPGNETVGEQPTADAGLPAQSGEAEKSAEDRADVVEGPAQEHAPEPIQDSTEAAVVETEEPAAEMPQTETGSADTVTVTGQSLEAPASVEAAAGEGLPVTEAEREAAPKEEPDLVVRCPHCEAESQLRELILASTGERVDVSTLAAALGLVPASEAEVGPRLSVWGQPVGTAPQIDFGHGGGSGVEEVHEGAFAFAGGGEGDKPIGTAAARAKRRKGEKSVLKEMIGAVFGAVLAVPIAYYLLNLIGGERFDKVPVPLPFCPHTYDHLPSDWPDWWPNWARLSAPAEETDSADLDELEIALDDPETDEALRRLDQARQGVAPAGDPTEPVAFQPETPAEETPNPEKAAPSKAKPGATKPDKEDRALNGESPAAKPDRRHSREKPAAEKRPEAEPAPAEIESDSPDAITPEAYQRLQRIAEAITVVEGEPDAGVAGKTEAVRGVLRKAARDPENFDTIGQLAADAWKETDADRRGILLAGTVSRAASQGKGHSAEIELSGAGGTVPVLSDQPLSLAEGDRVLVLGSIVQDAAEKLADFGPSQAKVVWVGLTLKIGE